MTGYLDKRLFANAIGNINKLYSGTTAKISPDARIQLDIVAMGLLRKITTSCHNSTHFAERSVITHRTIIKALGEMCTPEIRDNMDKVVDVSIETYLNRRGSGPLRSNNIVGSTTVLLTRPSEKVDERSYHDTSSRHTSIRLAAGLLISPSACKKIVAGRLPSIQVTTVASVALAAFIEYIIGLFVKAAGELVRAYGSIVHTRHLVSAIGQDGILRDFVVKHNIYFCGAGIAILSAHGTLRPPSEKPLLSYKKMRSIIFSILGQPEESAIIYKLSHSAVIDLFSFVEARVINILRDVVEIVWRLRGKKYITPLHVRYVAEAKGIVIREASSPLRRNTAKTFLEIAGSDAVAKTTYGESVEAIISSLIEFECTRILDKAIAAMDYSSRTILKPKFIREGGLNSDFIICSYVRPTHTSLSAVTI